MWSVLSRMVAGELTIKGRDNKAFDNMNRCGWTIHIYSEVVTVHEQKGGAIINIVVGIFIKMIFLSARLIGCIFGRFQKHKRRPS